MVTTGNLEHASQAHNMNCVRSKTGKEKDEGFRVLLASFLLFHLLNMQSIYLYRFSGLYCCLLLFFNRIMRSYFGMCVLALMEALVSVLLTVGMTTILQGNKKWRHYANSTDFQMERALQYSRISTGFLCPVLPAPVELHLALLISKY